MTPINTNVGALNARLYALTSTQGQNKAINAIMLNQRREREEKEKQEGQLPIDKLKEGDLKGDIRGVQRSGL